jgi:hypothetical protein
MLPTIAMKPLPIRLLLSALTTFSLWIGPVGQAAMGEITRPMLLVKDHPETQAALEKALGRPEAKYLQGHWLNRWSSLQYGGDTTALNKMIAELAECPGLSVAVTFQKLNNEASWMVGQDSNAPKVQVTINLSSRQIDLERISLPRWSGRTAQK